MTRTIALTLALSTCAMISGCAGVPDVPANPAVAMNSPVEPEYSLRDDTEAEKAGVEGNYTLEAQLAQKAYKEYPDPVAELNLASAYDHMGRQDKALPLYKDLALKGSNTLIAYGVNPDGSIGPSVDSISNIAAERLGWSDHSEGPTRVALGIGIN